ncbi:hypothetical protein FRC17_004869, partial [Serendipita sp. 399]
LKRKNDIQTRKRHDLRFTPYGAKDKDIEAASARREWQLNAKEKQNIARKQKAQEPENASEDEVQPVVSPRPSPSSATRQYVLDTLKHPGNPLTNTHSIPHVAESHFTFYEPELIHFQTMSGVVQQAISKTTDEQIFLQSGAFGESEGARKVDAPQGLSYLLQQSEPKSLRHASMFQLIPISGGYCANTTDLELKQLVAEYGGVVA